MELLTDPTKPKNISLEAAIKRERTARLAMPGGYHYWQARGDNTPPPEEHFCSHCGGWYGVPTPSAKAVSSPTTRADSAGTRSHPTGARALTAA